MARIGLHSLVAFVQLLQADHVSHDSEPVSCRCSPNPNPHASYTAWTSASGWLRRSFAAPGEERAFGDALCRLGQTATLSCTTTTWNAWCTSFPILIAPVRPSSCPQVPSCEDNSVIADVQGTARRAIIRHLEARGQLSDLSTVSWSNCRTAADAIRSGQFTPLVRGANTFQFRGGEVEIARIQLESTTADVVSIPAKIGARSLATKKPKAESNAEQQALL